MTLSRLQITDKVFIRNSTLVEENKIKAKVHAVDTPKIIFHGEYLNPAMAIIFTGYVSFLNPNREIIKRLFTTVSHTVEIDSSDRERFTDNCNDVIGNILSKTESSLQAIGIELSASYFLRCQQANDDNQQELAATRLKEILSNPVLISEIAADSVLDHELTFSTDYEAHIMEERENLAPDGDSDGIHFFVRALPNAQPQVLFYKGFETLDKLVCKKEENCFAQSRHLLLNSQSATLVRPVSEERHLDEITRSLR